MKYADVKLFGIKPANDFTPVTHLRVSETLVGKTIDQDADAGRGRFTLGYSHTGHAMQQPTQPALNNLCEVRAIGRLVDGTNPGR